MEIPQQEIYAFCLRWNVQEFSLFGSVLREDFAPTSDIDVLTTSCQKRLGACINLHTLWTSRQPTAPVEASYSIINKSVPFSFSVSRRRGCAMIKVVSDP